MNIGEKIQTIRKDNKLSQEEFAEKLGVSRQAISKWELGDSVPDIAKLALISKTFNVSSDSIIFETVDLNGIAIEQERPAEETKFEKVAVYTGKAVKKYVHIVGYILIVFGTVNLILSAILGIIWNGFSRELSNLLMQYNISLNLQFLFWIFIFMAIVAIITMGIGLVIAVKGKKANN